MPAARRELANFFQLRHCAAIDVANVFYDLVSL